MTEINQENTLVLALSLGYEFKDKTDKYFLLEKNEHQIYFFHFQGKLQNISIGYNHLGSINNEELISFENNDTEFEIQRDLETDQELLSDLKEGEILKYIFKLLNLKSNPFLKEKVFNQIQNISQFKKLFYTYPGNKLAIPLYNEDNQLQDLIIFSKNNFFQKFKIDKTHYSLKDIKKIEKQDNLLIYFNPNTFLSYFEEHFYDEELYYLIAGKDYYTTFPNTQIFISNSYMELYLTINYLIKSINKHYIDTGLFLTFYTTKNLCYFKINYFKAKIKTLKVISIFNNLSKKFSVQVEKKFPSLKNKIILKSCQNTSKTNKFATLTIWATKKKIFLEILLQEILKFTKENTDIILPKINKL